MQLIDFNLFIIQIEHPQPEVQSALLWQILFQHKTLQHFKKLKKTTFLKYFTWQQN